MFTLPASVKGIKRTALVLFLLFLCTVAPTAQAQTLTIGSAEACAAPEVLVPVTGINLTDVGSLTLYITFDSTRVSYLSVENIDPQLTGIVYALNTSPFQISIVWSKIIPAIFNQKKLFDIRLAFKGEETPITFKSNCEISNTQLQILPVNFIDGSVTSGFPQISSQPNDTVVKPWTLATFSTNAANTLNYYWKESRDNGLTWTDLTDDAVYQGTHTPELTLAYTSPSFSKYRYMCTLHSQTCTINTQQATLTVDTLASVPGYAVANDFLLQNKPNPVIGFTTFEYNLPAEGQVTIEIIDMSGRIIAQPISERQFQGIHNINYNAIELAEGLYFYRLNFKSEKSSFIATRKMIKQLNQK